MAIISSKIDNYDIKKSRLIDIYKRCPSSDKILVFCEKVDLHHIKSDDRLITMFQNNSKTYVDKKALIALFIHSFINLLPMEHNAHIARLNVSKNEYTDREFKLLLNYFEDNIEDLKCLSWFYGSNKNLVDISIKAFDSCGMNPSWFSKFR